MDFENIGNQDAFEELSKSSDKMKKSSQTFKSSAGMFMAGILAFDAITKRHAQGIKSTKQTITDQLKFFVKEPIKILSLSSVADSIAHLGSEIVGVKVLLGKEMGITIDRQTGFLSGLMRQHELLSEYGFTLNDNYEAFKGLYSEFRNIQTPFNIKDLTSTTALIGDVFDLKGSDASELVGSLVMFGKKDAKGITDWSNRLVESSGQYNLNYIEVMKQVSGIAKYMYKFNISSKVGMSNVKDMAIFAERAGVNLEKVVGATDKYRNFQEAMQATVTASRFGMNIDMRALMASARGGDSTMLLKRVLDKMQRYTDKSGNISQIGIDIADNLAPLVGLDREELLKATKRIAMNTGMSSQKWIDMTTLARENRDYLNQIKVSLSNLLATTINSLAEKAFPAIQKGVGFITKLLSGFKQPLKEFSTAIFDIVSPLVQGIWWAVAPIVSLLGKLVGWAMKNETLVKTLTGAAIAWFVFDKAWKVKQFVAGKLNVYKHGLAGASNLGPDGFSMWKQKQLGKVSRGGRVSRLFSTFSGKEIHQVRDPATGRLTNRAQIVNPNVARSTRQPRVPGQASRTMGASQMRDPATGRFTNQGAFNSKMMAAQAKQWLAGAAAMLILAGAVWIMSDALSKLKKANVGWKELGIMTAGIAGLGAIAALLSTISPAILGGSIAIGVMSGAMWLLGSAMTKFVPIGEVFNKSLENIGNLATILSESNPFKIGASMFAMAGGYGAMVATGGIFNSTPASPKTQHMDLSTNELTNAIRGLTVVMNKQMEYIPVELKTEVKLDGDVLVDKISKRVIKLIPSARR